MMPFDSQSSETMENLTQKKKSTVKKSQTTKKRKQVKKACVNCRKAHSCCDDNRPCKRCVDLGIQDYCRDTENKKRGRKRKPPVVEESINFENHNHISTFHINDKPDKKIKMEVPSNQQYKLTTRVTQQINEEIKSSYDNNRSTYSTIQQHYQTPSSGNQYHHMPQLTKQILEWNNFQSSGNHSNQLYNSQRHVNLSQFHTTPQFNVQQSNSQQQIRQSVLPNQIPHYNTFDTRENKEKQLQLHKPELTMSDLSQIYKHLQDVEHEYQFGVPFRERYPHAKNEDFGVPLAIDPSNKDQNLLNLKIDQQLTLTKPVYRSKHSQFNEALYSREMLQNDMKVKTMFHNNTQMYKPVHPVFSSPEEMIKEIARLRQEIESLKSNMRIISGSSNLCWALIGESGENCGSCITVDGGKIVAWNSVVWV